jgi:predicted Rossmann fold flavoprotein
VREPDSYDAIILGAGGAGLMCAAVAGQRGKRVLLIDHAEHAGKKILISGGGRCNFTNRGAKASCYLSDNPHFAKSALSRYTPGDFIALVDRYGIAWHEKELDQLFCDGSAKQIVAMLLDECVKGAVELKVGHRVSKVDAFEGRYHIEYGDETAEAPALVIATGGPSIPKMGATGFAFELAKHFNLKVIPPRPALVPFTLGNDDAVFRELSGVSADVIARCGKTAFRGGALFTHKGLSGPAILQISSYWSPGDPIGIDFLPDQNPGWLLDAKQSTPRQMVRTVLGRMLSDRLAATLAQQIGLEMELGNLPDRAIQNAEGRLRDWQFSPTGTEGFAKAEVTAGGIDTSGLSSKTMEAKAVPGLYVIGEAVDVTGWLGGYNFQWAWASGWVAGTSL